MISTAAIFVPRSLQIGILFWKVIPTKSRFTHITSDSTCPIQLQATMAGSILKFSNYLCVQVSTQESLQKDKKWTPFPSLETCWLVIRSQGVQTCTTSPGANSKEIEWIPCSPSGSSNATSRYVVAHLRSLPIRICPCSPLVSFNEPSGSVQESAGGGGIPLYVYITCVCVCDLCYWSMCVYIFMYVYIYMYIYIFYQTNICLICIYHIQDVYIILYYIISYHLILYYIILYYIISYHIISYHIISKYYIIVYQII